MNRMLILLLVFLPLRGLTQALGSVKPFGPLPSEAQLQWHETEFYLFVHFGPNTFTNKEWGEGDEPADAFNPKKLDCRQWARVAKAAGAKGIIITAKHHDGFCLWPSKYSKHTVRESKWKDGKGDVLKELSQACSEYGLKFGVYISPWDRNHPQYGTPQYNDVFVNMMKEIFQNYGPIWELWWDGANGEGPNGKRQEYDWARFKDTVKKLSPNTVVFSDVGPHIRWIGNEKGIAGKTNWNLLDTAGFTPGAGAPDVKILNEGNEMGKVWLPGECDVSIRPGWFFHENENDKVKTPEQLFDLYLKSVGRGANFLLNVPPDANGLIHANDSASLVKFKELLDKNLLNATKVRYDRFEYKHVMSFTTVDSRKKTVYNFYDNYRDGFIKFNFTNPKKINCIVLREPIEYGQRVKNLVVTLKSTNGREEKIQATTIGRKRILSFPAREVSQMTVQVADAKANPVLSEISFYLIDEKLVEKD
ncbi:MAG: alpha-L-fucosidase [Chitinophagaceae bacterium]